MVVVIVAVNIVFLFAVAVPAAVVIIVTNRGIDLICCFDQLSYGICRCNKLNK